MRPYYQQAGVTIYHGDCRDVLPHVRADLMVTDPPFGVGKAAWDTAFVLPPSVPAPILALMPGVANMLRCPATIEGLAYQWTLSAYLTNGMTRGAFGFGNWIPCLVYAAESVTLFGYRQDAKAFAIGTAAKPDHPCPKPLNVMRWLLSCLPGDSVIDPFMGSGTTVCAAKELGRQAIGIEINERYCEIAATRLQQDVLPFSA